MLLLLLLYAPPSFTLVGNDLPLPQVLAALRKQAGIQLRVELPHPPSVSLDLRAVPPWQALHAIASRVTGQILPAGRDGRLRLVPMPKGALPPLLSYHGAFRCRAFRTSAARDLDTGRGGTTLSLEIAWLPGTRPLYIDSVASGVRLVDSRGVVVPVTAESGNLDPVEGRTSVMRDVALPGLPRAHARIGQVEGVFNAVVASDLLRFAFDSSLAGMTTALPGGQVRSQKQKDVACHVDRLVLGRDRWSIRMALDYPPGNRELDSYQAGAMVAFNQLRLVSADGKRFLLPTAYVADSTSARRVVVTYHFTETGAAPRARSSMWRLEYTAPARIIDVPLRFSFRNVPLP